MTDLKLLLVDDDEIFQDLFCEVLTNLGFLDVECKSSSSDALFYLSREGSGFDCIFLDIMMPGIDGIELCQKIRKLSDYRDAYIIMISGEGDMSSINESFLAGAMDFITKPFHPMELRSRLRLAQKLLSEKRENYNKDLVIKVLQQKLTSRSRHEANWRSSFSEIDGFLSFLDFEDKLLRSRKSTLMSSEIFGISVVDAHSLSRSVSQSVFQDVISKVARHISGRTEQFRRIFTYIGDGKFICLCAKEPRSASSSSIVDVLREGSTIAFDLDSEPRYLIRLEVSNPVRKGGLFVESPLKLIYAVTGTFSNHSEKHEVFLE